MSIARMPVHERNANIIRMAKGGWRPRDIHERTGISVYTVYGVIARARQAGERIPYFCTGRAGSPGERRVKIARGTAATLEAAAARRGISLHDLTQKLLEAIVADGLIDAVLDDDGEEAE